VIRFNRWLCAFMACATAGVAQAALLPGDAARGKQLHNSRCLACHDGRVYTRPDRKVKSIEGLIGQVRRCDRQLGTQLERGQRNDLVKYLNDTYYRFP